MTVNQFKNEKCFECNEAATARHVKYFMEGWDVHPEDNFRKWWARHPEARKGGVITAWNTDRNRLEFDRYLKGIPEPEEAPATRTETFQAIEAVLRRVTARRDAMQ